MGRRKFLLSQELYKSPPKLSSILCPRASGPSATCLKSWGQEGNEVFFIRSYGSWFWLELGTSVLLHIHHSIQCGLVWASLHHGAWLSPEQAFPKTESQMEAVLPFANKHRVHRTPFMKTVTSPHQVSRKENTDPASHWRRAKFAL